MTSPILVIFTGGTIGSTARNGIISVEAQKTFRLLEVYEASGVGLDVDFNTLEVLNILSENARPHHWSVIADAVINADLSAYAGVIVTHGTDTLAYASAALGFALSDLDVPVVLVSSNKPLEAQDSNGFANFSHAVTFIVQNGLRGVYATYRNPDGRSYLHLGTRLTSALPFIHSFRSEKDAFIAEIKDGGFEFNASPHAVRPDMLTQRAEGYALSPRFCEDVLYLRPYPGLNYEYFNLLGKPAAILHDLYHSGTACTQTDDEKLSVLRFAERCARADIPFYVAPVPGAGDIYETCRDLIDVGVVPLQDMAVEAAMVKIMLAHGNAEKLADVPRFVQEVELAHEFIRDGPPNI